jgi:hypothetical protein
VFNSKYFSFLTAIITSAGVNMDDIVILSIVSGSVNVSMLVSSTSVAGSNSAITTQDNIQALLGSGSIGGMTVTKSTLTTNGGTNGNDSSGLSTTTIIILATVIPIGTLCNYCLI